MFIFFYKPSYTIYCNSTYIILRENVTVQLIVLILFCEYSDFKVI